MTAPTIACSGSASASSTSASLTSTIRGRPSRMQRPRTSISHRLAVAGRAEADLHVLGGALADEQAVAAAHEADDRVVHVVAGGADGAGVDHAAERDDRDVGGAAADVDDHAAGGFGDRQAGADGRGHRLFDEVHLAGLGAVGAVDDGAALHLGDARRDADDQPRAPPGDAALGLADEMAQQPFGGFEVGDHAVAQRPNRGDVGRRAAEHRVGRVADGLGLVALRVDGDDRGLVDHDAAPGSEDDGVGSAEIDREIASGEGQDVQQHGTFDGAILPQFGKVCRRVTPRHFSRSPCNVRRAITAQHVRAMTARDEVVDADKMSRASTLT